MFITTIDAIRRMSTCREERQMTVNELANQKGVLQKTSGWQLYHVAAQFEELAKFESETMDELKQAQNDMPMPRNKTPAITEDDITMVNEIRQGNIQRCQAFIDQMEEARTQMLRLLTHKPRIHEIVNKHHSKRPVKRKDR